jgi:hypothetical protein
MGDKICIYNCGGETWCKARDGDNTEMGIGREVSGYVCGPHQPTIALVLAAFNFRLLVPESYFSYMFIMGEGKQNNHVVLGITNFA